ncbi:MAG: class I SAM-dependent methyltransferase [Gammaproteobacteria bacterium]|nr:class I SAM-dependent methyltransferase [Gammaproteobacteria bacterium]
MGRERGNYICALAKDLPKAAFYHVDADQKMNDVAKDKYAAAGVKNVEMHGVSALDAEFQPGSFDLIICVNALYAIHPPEEMLRQAKSWLKPDGVFFVIDFGRRTQMWDWSKYIFGSILREHGLMETIRFCINGMETYRQNRRGNTRVRRKEFIGFTPTEEFKEALVRAGFSIEKIQTCYRGYCGSSPFAGREYAS